MCHFPAYLVQIAPRRAGLNSNDLVDLARPIEQLLAVGQAHPQRYVVLAAFLGEALVHTKLLAQNLNVDSGFILSPRWIS